MDKIFNTEKIIFDKLTSFK